MKLSMFALAALALPLLLTAQNEQNLAQGKSVFRSNCAFCHGITATGGRGPSLISERLIHGASDEQIKAIITNGVPGTNMPSFESLEKDDLDNLIHYIRSLAGTSVNNGRVPGNPTAGRAIYQKSGCSGCHRIGNEGSDYGPELTRIGSGRSVDYIRESIVDPSADIPQEYEGVTVVTRDGKRLTGMRVNEDTFTVQMRLPNQHFAMFDKGRVKEVINETKSLMPSYKLLPAQDLQNLIAYLETLRGENTATADPAKAKGIH